MNNRDEDETRYLQRPQQYFPPQGQRPSYEQPTYQQPSYEQYDRPAAPQAPKQGLSVASWVALIVGGLIAAGLFFLLGRMTAAPDTEVVESTVTETVTQTATTTVTAPAEPDGSSDGIGGFELPSQLQSPDVEGWLNDLLGSNDESGEPTEQNPGFGQ